MTRTNSEQVLRAQRRSDNLQRAQARGNTVLQPQYVAGPNDSQRYIGHRAKFAVRMQSSLMANVSRVALGPKVADETTNAVIVGLRHATQAPLLATAHA